MATKNKEKEANGAGKAPAYQTRIGAVRGTVWMHAVEGRTYFNVNLVRRYKDENEWKDSSTLNGVGDAVAAIEALRCCVEFIHQQEDALNAETMHD